MNVNEIIIKVLLTCIPVFAVMWLGYILRRSRFMSESAHAFLNKFVFYFSLPLMVFLGISSSNLREIFHPVVFWTTIPVIIFSGILFFILGKQIKMPPNKLPILALSAFWGNTVYLGFPLVEQAFGSNALNYAAMMNALSLPFLIGLGTLLLTAKSESKNGSLIKRLIPVMKNPIIQAVILGVLFSFLIHQGNLKILPRHYIFFSGLLDIFLKTAGFLKAVGMPLALLVVGGAINLKRIKGEKEVLLLNSTAKLIITPFFSFLIALNFFKDAPLQAVGPSLLLMGMPLSVTACIISSKMGADEEMVSATLVISTILSCVTAPLLIGIILYFFQ